MDGISFGNSGSNLPERNGWIVGRFLDEDANRRTEAVEVKWGAHRRGQRNERFAANRTATSISILLAGRFRLTFRRGDETMTILLENKGDYALWGPGIFHDWEAETDCEILTIRWPSARDDQVSFDHPD